MSDVLPNHKTNWAGMCLTAAGEGKSEEWKAGFNYAMNVMAFWIEFNRTGHPRTDQLSKVGMMKSALLGRLMRGEELRQRPCPIHKGHLCQMDFGPLGFTGKEQLGSGMREWILCCDGTGFLPNGVEGDERLAALMHMDRGAGI